MGKTDAETIVIGAGIVGACVARTLAEVGQRVVVLDALPIASSATRRAIGVAAPSLGEALIADSLRGVSLLRELAERSGLPFAETKVMHLVSRVRDTDTLRALVDGLNRAGLQASWEISPSVVPGGFGGGLLIGPALQLDPIKLCRSLLTHTGIVVRADTQAQRIAANGATWVTAEGLALSADAVVLATNAYAGLLSPYAIESVSLVREAAWTSAPLPADAQHLLRQWPMQIDRGRIALVSDDRGRLRITARSPSNHAQYDPGEDIRQFIKTRAPDLLSQTQEWASGVTTAANDGAPVVEKLGGDANAVVALGAGVNGLAWAPLMAERVMALLH